MTSVPRAAVGGTPFTFDPNEEAEENIADRFISYDLEAPPVVAGSSWATLIVGSRMGRSDSVEDPGTGYDVQNLF